MCCLVNRVANEGLHAQVWSTGSDLCCNCWLALESCYLLLLSGSEATVHFMFSLQPLCRACQHAPACCPAQAACPLFKEFFAEYGVQGGANLTCKKHIDVMQAFVRIIKQKRSLFLGEGTTLAYGQAVAFPAIGRKHDFPGTCVHGVSNALGFYGLALNLYIA